MDNLDKLSDTYNEAIPTKPPGVVEILRNISLILPKLILLLVRFGVVFVKNLIFCFVPATKKDITNQVVLVTGGANGLGKALSLRFAAEGAHIAVADLDLTNAQVLAKEIREKYGVKAFPYKLDVANYTSVETCRANIERDLGPVDILVNNAGVLPLASLREGKPSDLERIINVNLTAHIWTNRVFLEPMIKNRRGHIVAIASVAGIAPGLRAITYSASKCGVRGMMVALQDELECDGLDDCIHTTTVFPWFINTRKELEDRVFSKVPLIRFLGIMTPKYVAACAVRSVLANEESCIIPRVYKWLFLLQGSLPREYRKCVRTTLMGDVPKMM